MIITVTRLVTNFLRDHPQYSVAKMLEAQTPQGTDKRPTSSTPIYNDVDDEDVANTIDQQAVALMPKKTPCLIVVSGGTIQYDISRPRRALDIHDLRMSIAYIIRAEPSAVKNRRDGGYVLRAVADSLLQLNEPSVGSSWRLLVDMEFIELRQLLEARIKTPVGKDCRMEGAVVATVRARRKL